MAAIFGTGIYTFSEAAKLTKLKVSRIREWFRIHGKLPMSVFRNQYEEQDGHYAISFLDLIDVFVAGQLRNYGVSLQTLRKVYKKLSKDLETPHPFSRKELLTDGKIVFVTGLDSKGKVEIQEALSNQGVFPEIIIPFLKRIDYDHATSLALRWHYTEHVVLDPTICFGQPIVGDVGIPTYILSGAYRANNNNENKVAEWYKIQPSQVIAAVQFESSFAA